MVYVFGDSYIWGWNFFTDAELKDKREELTWPSLLAKKLNQPLINFSLPASSNWRIARILQSLNLTKDDYVIIGWTSPTRFEFGLADDYDIEPSHPDIHYRITDYNEDDGITRTKRMSYHLMDRTTCQYARNFMWHAYGPFNSEAWYREMFKVMFTSCQNILDKSECKWIAFDVWCDQCEQTDFNDVKNYIFRDTNLLNYSRNIPGKETDKEYWSKEEHIHIAELLMEELQNERIDIR